MFDKNTKVKDLREITFKLLWHLVWIIYKLIENGYLVDCVSPSSNLSKHVRNRLGNRSVIFETRFEDLETEKCYDLILCSESFQYLLLEKAISNDLISLRFVV